MPEGYDQAAGLRRLQQSGAVKVIAVSSGKGGVGKTNVSVNLAIALAQSGRSTLLVDADLGLANVDVLLGLQPAMNLSQVLAGQIELQDAVIEGPCGVRILPAASGIAEIADLSPAAQGGLIGAFSSLPFALDLMLVDTASGINNVVTGFCQAADEVVVVVCDEPASITDAYALIKVLSRERHIRRFQILCNRVADAMHGRNLYRKLLTVCDRFLDVALVHFGSVPEDISIRRATRQQRAVVDVYPSSAAGRAFKEMARRADNWVTPAHAGGGPAFFLERAIPAAAMPVAE